MGMLATIRTNQKSRRKSKRQAKETSAQDSVGLIWSGPEPRLIRKCVPPLRHLAQRIAAAPVKWLCQRGDSGCQIELRALYQAFGQRRRGHRVVKVAQRLLQLLA